MAPLSRINNVKRLKCRTVESIVHLDFQWTANGVDGQQASAGMGMGGGRRMARWAKGS